MRPPILAAVDFGDGDHGDMYRRLAEVLRFTAEQHCPEWDRRIDHIVPTDYSSAMVNPSHVWNTQKLEYWRDTVARAEDGDRVLLMDADMFIGRSLDVAWKNTAFDVAYTVREVGRLPLNGGVVFLRVSDRTRQFMDAWWETNLRFLNNRVEHARWRAKYAGINQASFGFLLEKVRHGCALAKLPCREWNCENTEWSNYDPKVTRIVHVKSRYRRALFGATIDNRFAKLVPVWHALEAQARAAAVEV